MPAPGSPLRSSPTQAGDSTCGNRVELLGKFAVTRESFPVGGDVWKRTHARRLVQFVGSQRRGVAARAGVLEALWPGSDEPNARNRLHHTQHLIRKALDADPSQPPLALLIGSETIEFAQGVAVDVIEFQHHLTVEGCDATRLAALLKAVNLYRGDLACDWLDDHGMQARRVALRGDFLAALTEAAALCRDAADVEQALVLLQRLVAADPSDCQGHILLAETLFESGRRDAAVVHCQRARSLVAEALDPAAAQPLDELRKSLQRRANASEAASGPAPVLQPIARLAAKPRIEVVSQHLFGRDELLHEVGRNLDDPFSSLVSLCGPPGSGRTSVAVQVAVNLQDRLRDGAVLVGCAGAATAEGVAAAVAKALRPFVSAPCCTDDDVLAALRPLEMLLVVDDVMASDSTARFLAQLALSARDCRLLVISNRRLRVTGERSIAVDFVAQETAPQQGGHGRPAPAVELLFEQARARGARLRTDERLLASLGRIAALADGWPLALDVAGQWLTWMTPSEAIARLEGVNTDAQADPRSAQGLERIDGALALWTSDLSPACLALLTFCSVFETWFARKDLATLVSGPQRSEIDRFLDETIDRRLLLRRSSLSLAGEISEFRVPRLLRQSLRRRAVASGADFGVVRRMHLAWLQQSLAAIAARPGGGIPAAAIATLVDTHRADISAAVGFLAETGERDALLQFVTAMLPGLRIAADPGASAGWVSLALGVVGDDSAAAALFLQRAGLHHRLENKTQAFEDTERAYRLACDSAQPQLKDSALDLLQRLGRESGRSPTLQSSGASSHPLLSQGIEAGENLLRVAGVAARFGEFAKAVELSTKAVDVFRYFNCQNGQLRGLRYRGRMAFAIGNLPLSVSSAHESIRLAEQHNLAIEGARAQLLLSETELSEMQCDAASRRAERVLASTGAAGDLVIETRAFKILAWGHYFNGQTALAAVMHRELAQRAEALGDPGHVANGHLLCALLLCEESNVQKTLCAVATLHSVVTASPGPTDLQSELTNVAYLSARLRRPAAASGLLSALSVFARQPGHQLRPLTLMRLQGTEAILAGSLTPAEDGRQPRHTRDALQSLIAA